jgi:hypothetical protein
MSNIVRASQKAVVKSEGTAPVIGGALMVGGGSALAVGTLAMLLPGGLFLWAIVALVLGGFLTFKG